MHILYIEDEPADAQLVERYIRLTPHQLTLANNIKEANAAIKEALDLILVDILLERSRDGYDFVRELRAQGYTQPIIAVTGLTLPHDLEQCRQAGVNEVLAKPYAIQQLVDLLNKYTV
jgi:CheY-like chemotaxis protein